MAIKIPFVADVDGFIRGTKDVERGLDDVADALDDLDRSTAGDKVEQDLEGIGKAADASAEKVETSFRQAFKDVEAQGRTSTRKVKDDVDDVGSHGSATLHEFSQEAKQNVAESVSSFTGSAESAVDAVQSTFGGLVSALGPAGVVGAALAAAGIGLLRGMATKAQEAAEAVSQNAVDMAKSLREGITPAQQLNDALTDLADTATTTGKWWWADASTGLLDLIAVAEDAKLSIGEFLRATAGPDAAQTQSVLDSVNEKINTLNASIQEGAALETGGAQLYIDLKNQKRAREELTAQLDKQKAALAAHNAEVQYGAMTATELTSSTSALADAYASQAQATQDANDELRTNADLNGKAVESEWDVKDAIDAVSGARKDGGKSLNENTAAGRANLREIKAGIDAINAFGDAQLAATGDVQGTNAKLKAQEDALVNRVHKAFGITTTQARKYVEALGGIPKRKDTVVHVTDNGTAAATTKKVHDIPTSKEVKVTVNTDGIQEEIQRIVDGKVYRFDVAPRPGKAVGV